MTKRLAWLATSIAMLLAATVLAACGGDDSTDATAASASSSASSEGATVKIGTLQGVTLAAVARHIGSIDRALASVGARASYEGPFPAMVPAIEAMNAGDVDITYGSISAAIGALAGNSDFKIFAIEPNQPENEGIIAGRDSGIATAADLKGKKIAVNRAGTGEYLTLLALDRAGLSRDDVELVYLPPADAASAFGSGQVDAWATWSSFTGLAQDKLGGRLVISGGELGSLNDTPYIVSSEFAERHPALVAAVYRGLQDAAAWIAANPAEAARLYADAGLPDTVARAQVDAAERLEPITPAILARFQQVARYVAERGVVPGEVDLSDRTIDDVEEARR
ncbi:aliphatic sulfonate ABC transporter substrate-binding protein [Conexibacter woesei]|uniref:Putative aliphatic sulfonates-binding protein n=1 Tax=Conexibacter woesei (strain DSM 14684 / CCUG 47730 / CIP 108061 / JCM 11494 / NBRC 100937 / ID131577) TaxID=469383 RepID=D3F2G4_CONWI|nr:aliphatic sulfonate ABC transporter substrate-binding protein [Conexibacter woesei]ADB52230.1 aliphatic sulfonates family ABC transporter, periplasmic ligand-binding protein [Conexibacter woesei DSM 14684]